MGVMVREPGAKDERHTRDHCSSLRVTKQAPGIIAETIELLVVAVGSLIVSGLGLLVESRAVQAFLGGDPLAALWLLVLGAIFLYIGVYQLGYQQLLPRVHAATHPD